MDKIIKARPEEEQVPWVRLSDFYTIDFIRPVALVNGAFDVLHSGHMKIIYAAQRRAGTVICALDGNEKVRKAKGPGRPIQSWIERATTLSYMPLDYIVEIINDDDMEELVTIVRPDFRVQGFEYKKHKTRFPDIKRYFVYGTGMRTSILIDRILKGQEDA